jgi:hypothetical protein
MTVPTVDLQSNDLVLTSYEACLVKNCRLMPWGRQPVWPADRMVSTTLWGLSCGELKAWRRQPMWPVEDMVSTTLWGLSGVGTKGVETATCVALWRHGVHNPVRPVWWGYWRHGDRQPMWPVDEMVSATLWGLSGGVLKAWRRQPIWPVDYMVSLTLWGLSGGVPQCNCLVANHHGHTFAI